MRCAELAEEDNEGSPHRQASRVPGGDTDIVQGVLLWTSRVSASMTDLGLRKACASGFALLVLYGI